MIIRNRTTKLMILYICMFALTSTFFVWYSIDHLRMRQNEQHVTWSQASCNCTSRINNIKGLKASACFQNVRDVAKSLKTLPDGKEYFDRNQNTDFDRSLSIYDTEDRQILQTLFPIDENGVETTLKDRLQNQLKVRLKHAEPKLILVNFFDNHLTASAIHNNGCPVDNCQLTTNKKELPNADAVIFHQIPKRIRRSVNKPDQIWIYHQLESPATIPYITGNKESVNWTAAFRSDSVLPTPYGQFVSYEHVKELPLKADKNYAFGKIKVAAWFVSNCGGFNGRMAYARELQKYIKVDIYGFCGPLTCKRGRDGDKCMDMLRNDYKFYLSFENSNCRDYISEKFFYNALHHDVIPIVMGAHPEDYKRVAPPNSYIHVDEFNSPRQLAEYMHILDNNDDLYNEYFRWKGTGEFINTKFVCRLCAMVQMASIFPMWYRDISKWWTDDQCIRPGKLKWSTWK